LDGVPGKGIRLPFAQDRGAGDSVAIGSGTPHQQNPRDLLGGTGRQEPAAGGCGPRCNGATLGFPGLAFQEAVLVVKIKMEMMSLTWVNMPAVVAAKEGHIFDDGGTKVLSREFLRMLYDLSEDKRTQLHTGVTLRWEKTA
jgi:hypothetical protein